MLGKARLFFAPPSKRRPTVCPRLLIDKALLRHHSWGRPVEFRLPRSLTTTATSIQDLLRFCYIIQAISLSANRIHFPTSDRPFKWLAAFDSNPRSISRFRCLYSEASGEIDQGKSLKKMRVSKIGRTLKVRCSNTFSGEQVPCP